MHHVIIGCGAAGKAALQQIHKNDPKAKITVISDETDPFYLRPHLGYFLINDKLPPEAQKLADEELRELSGVEYILGTRVLRILPQENTLELSDGKRLTYSFLLIATGTKLITHDLAPYGANYFTLKNKADALRLKRLSLDTEAVLIYGGGYQALEMTRIFHLKGKKVRWIAPPGYFWPRQLPNVTAKEVRTKLADLGLDVVIDRHIVHVLDLDGKRYRITDSEGDTFECDILILAPNEVPGIDFMRGSSINTDRGILVNEELRTNIPNVFSAGDCAQVYDLNSGQSVVNFGWKSAVKQGIVAGENMAGMNSIIIPTQAEFILDLMGKKLLDRW